MVHKIPEETIQKLRELLASGTDASQVAQILDITTTTVYNYSKDLPRKYKRFSLEIRNEIRDKVRNGLLKHEAAKMYDCSLRTIVTITKDIPGYFGYKNNLSHEELQLLRRLMLNGYLISDFYLYAARNLKLHLPKLQSIRIHGKTIFYLAGREKETIEAYIRSSKSHFIDYSDINELSRMMGITLQEKEKENFVHQIKRKKSAQLTMEQCGLEYRF